MTRFKRLLVLMLFAAVLTSGFVLGCSKLDPGTRALNIPPETTLSFSPADSSEANYRVRMNWFGWDPDGEVVKFETAWDKPDDVESWSTWIDSVGRAVVGTDSIFMLAAADEFDDDNAYAVHSFAVRAVDNEGAYDDTPEALVFTAVTVLPQTRITRGPDPVTGPMVTFEWTGTDRDGVITGYDYRLFAKPPDAEWVQVVPDPEVAESVSVGPDETTILFGPLSGLHRFEVWATDDAGAADQTPALSQFNVNPELAGPKLYIGTNVFGTHTFRGPVWPDRYNYADPIFAGERLAFAWVATADDYGGIVTGYRHAYDDTTVWPPWSIFDRYRRVVPTIGRHSLYVSALDNANVMTRARMYFDVVEASLDEYILVVDDYDWWEHRPEWGTDEDRNAFYNRILSGYVRILDEWEPSQHMDADRPLPPDVEKLRGASTVIWYCDSAGATIADVFNPTQPMYNALAGYLRVGGNIILSGSKVMTQVTSDPYVINIAPSDSSTAAIFIRDYLHIGRIDNSGEGANHGSPWDYGYCMHGALPTPEGEALGFEPVYVDTGDCDVEPGKWWFYCDPPLPGYYHCGLNVEKLVNFQGSGLEIYATDSFLNPNYEDETSVVLYLSGDNRGNACYIGFPLYYCQEDQVKHMIDRVMALFGEEKVR
jgi:hypothetical protein